MFGKQRTSFFLASMVLPSLLFFCLFFLTPGASARLGLAKIETIIEIDGVNYGVISEINNIRDLTLGPNQNENFTRVSLKRDFVTDPSLYLWAHNSAQSRGSLKHINIVTQTKDGYKLARYELKNCKPLSWTVETADPSQGGFHEKIDLAVQEIAVF